MKPGAEFFKKNGYYIAQGILPLDALDGATRDMNEIVVQQLKRLGKADEPYQGIQSLYVNLMALHRADIHAYLASMRLCAKLYSIHSMSMHSNILEFAKGIGISLPCFQTQPVLHPMSDELRIPGGYMGFDPHQDWTALQSGLDTSVVWIPLTDIFKDMYTMDVLPGSHLLGLCEGAQKEHVFEVDPKYYKDQPFVSLEMKRGDVFFMSVFMIHRTSMIGRAGSLRLSCSVRYENASEPTFVARNYPFTQKRVVDRTILTPGFPTRDQVKKVFEIS